MAQQLELGVISSTRMETRVGPEGDFRAKKIGRVEAAYRSGREGHVLPHLGTVPEMVAP